MQLADLLDEAPPSQRAGARDRARARAAHCAVYRRSGLPRAAVARPDRRDARGARRTAPRARAPCARGDRDAGGGAARQHRAAPAHARAATTTCPRSRTLAEKLLADVGHDRGALTHRSVSRMAETLGFELVHVDDLPHSARSVTDLENGRIYLPPASIPGGHGLRGMALQAMAHRVLGHELPETYADFLQQRLEINYFAAAVLMPRRQSVSSSARRRPTATSRSRTSATRSASPTRPRRCASPTSRRRTSTSRCTSCGWATTARSRRPTRTTGCGCRWM